MEASQVSKKIIAFGSKQIFLPKFTIALIRTPSLSPYHARFLVPLNFSKYDLRDYLYHAYDIKTFNIRSFVKQMPVRDTREQPRHWFRPESKKYMTVEMEKPFVWPAEPESWAPWGKEEKEKQVSEMVDMSGGGSLEGKRREARELRGQVKRLLGWEGKGVDEVEEELDEDGIKQKRTTREEEEEARKEVQRALSRRGRKSLLKVWEEKRSPEMLGRRYA